MAGPIGQMDNTSLPLSMWPIVVVHVADRGRVSSVAAKGSNRRGGTVVLMSSQDPQSILDLFSALEDQLRERLLGLHDWGLSGERDGQYVHDVVADEVLLGPLVDAGFRVLSEESGMVGSGPITVVVDPVDGSTNASHGLPWFATSLCAVDDDGPLVSLVSNLVLGDRYRAIRGEGIEVDRVLGSSPTRSGPAGPSGVTRLSDALVAFSGWPPEHGGWRQYRACGASALDLCAVAVGTFDAFMDIDSAHGVWDYLGAMLVCQEAGAVLSDADGADLVVLSHSARRGPVAAATPELLEEILGMRAGWTRSQAETSGLPG